MSFEQRRVLGRTGLTVGRLGIASGYGAPTAAIEAAFERGCNYFYWGSRRTGAMAQAIRNICAQGRRDDLVIVIQSYSRSAWYLEVSCQKALRTVGLDGADVLLLGWHNNLPSNRIIDRALSMKERGLFRFLAVSGHHRPLFPRLAQDGRFDICHIRYSAAHRGAETEAFPDLQGQSRPGVVTYTATRWGRLLNPKKMPPGESAPTASDCYRFVLSHPAVDVCMCGPKNTAQMNEALRTLDRGPLSPEEMDRMRAIGDFVHG
jgi:aryl-alcohol dehydrogenase-like predicted oxidoreductase